MPYRNLIFEKKDHIGAITFNRPRVLNALNRETMDELDALLSEVRNDTDVRVLILTGAGDKAFIAGADINELARQTPTSGRETSLHGQAVLHKLETLGKPSIAAINGFALGGGCEIAMACDIRVASENAKFGQPEVNLGIPPGYGGTQRLPRLAGMGMALYLCLTGETIDAREALRIGLVQRVVPIAELLPEARRIAGLIASKAPLAVAATKRAIREGADLPLAHALNLEALLFGQLTASADFGEGAAAFVEKRKPVFRGN